MRGLNTIIALVMLGSGGAAIAADEQPICANRPGKSTPACTVPAGHWQIETGLADWSLQKPGGGERDTTFTLGETTFLYGLTSSSDIEIDVTPWERMTSRVAGTHQSASGFGDIRLLYKQQLTANDAAVQISAIPFFKLPTAKQPLGNRKFESGLLVTFDYNIPKSNLSLETTPELDWASDANGSGHHAAMVQVLNLGWQTTPKLNLSAEIWGRWDWDPAGTTEEYSADGSVAYLVNNNTQLDAGANFGLNRNTPDVELYTGVSVRF